MLQLLSLVVVTYVPKMPVPCSCLKNKGWDWDLLVE